MAWRLKAWRLKAWRLKTWRLKAGRLKAWRFMLLPLLALLMLAPRAASAEDYEPFTEARLQELLQNESCDRASGRFHQRARSAAAAGVARKFHLRVRQPQPVPLRHLAGISARDPVHQRRPVGADIHRRRAAARLRAARDHVVRLRKRDLRAPRLSAPGGRAQKLATFRRGSAMRALSWRRCAADLQFLSALARLLRLRAGHLSARPDRPEGGQELRGLRGRSRQDRRLQGPDLSLRQPGEPLSRSAPVPRQHGDAGPEALSLSAQRPPGHCPDRAQPPADLSQACRRRRLRGQREAAAGEAAGVPARATVRTATPCDRSRSSCAARMRRG